MGPITAMIRSLARLHVNMARNREKGISVGRSKDRESLHTCRMSGQGSQIQTASCTIVMLNVYFFLKRAWRRPFSPEVFPT